jgi:class 3 adenylate cyclase
VRETAVRADLRQALPDLDTIAAAAASLFRLVDQLLDKERAGTLLEGADIQATQRSLRHDLRTPLNGVRGFSELVLEDLEQLGGEVLRADLERLVQEVDELLSQLERIVDFSQHDHDAPENAGGGAVEAMISELFRDIRPVSETAQSAVAPARILVVDDIATNRDLLSRRLALEGHGVVAAGGGREALERLQNEDFDLVLLDLMMPEMNGFEVLARIKSDDRLHRLPVIMVSALDEVDSVVRCIEAGAEDYLTKPVDPVVLRARINANLEKKRWRERERVYLDRLETEKERYEKLLVSILPHRIVDRLNSGEGLIADRFDEASVLFSDLVGFTAFSSTTSPAGLVDYLNQIFSRFDALARALQVEKVKTIGDAYMVVAGLPEPRLDHAAALADMALGMVEIIDEANRTLAPNFQLRVGVHSGPVVAGVIGTHRFIYDVWGDTVNVASRLETTSLPGRIHISEATAAELGDRFVLEPRGDVEIKGRGTMSTFFLLGRT